LFNAASGVPKGDKRPTPSQDSGDHGVPAPQAIGTVAAKELLIVAPARDQCVIPGQAKDALTPVVASDQEVIARATIDVRHGGNSCWALT
jgi:hypothetical protein